MTTIGPRGPQQRPVDPGRVEDVARRAGGADSTISPPRSAATVAQRRAAGSGCSGRCRAGPRRGGSRRRPSRRQRRQISAATSRARRRPRASGARARGRRRPCASRVAEHLEHGVRERGGVARRRRGGPVTPSSTTSARPPTRVATTGVPAFIASASTVPNGSWCEGRTSTSSAPMRPGGAVDPPVVLDARARADLAQRTPGRCRRGRRRRGRRARPPRGCGARRRRGPARPCAARCGRRSRRRARPPAATAA